LWSNPRQKTNRQLNALSTHRALDNIRPPLLADMRPFISATPSLRHIFNYMILLNN
jgi:hypothetical protein